MPGPDPPPGPADADGAPLTEGEVALVLRRASELNAAGGFGLTRGDELVPLSAVEAAAGEAGIEVADVRRAVAELRAGLLDAADDAPRSRAGVVVTVTRIVPCAPPAAGVAIARWLTRQTFMAVRDQGTVQRWRRRDDPGATVRRAVALRGTVRVDAACEVVVRVVPTERGSLVRLDADLGPRSRQAPPAAGGVVGVTAAAGSSVAAVATTPALFAVGVPASMALGYGGFRLARAFVRRDQVRVSDALAGFLDDLERRPRPPHPRRRRPRPFRTRHPLEPSVETSVLIRRRDARGRRLCLARFQAGSSPVRR